jgi:hypothetical protein
MEQNLAKGRLISSMRCMISVLSFLFVLAGVPAQSQHSDAERLQDLRRMIEQEIGIPSANEPIQCKLMPFGSKPCGGPWGYLVYSTLKTDEARLKQLVSEFNQLQKKMNEESKIMSDCAIAPEPKVEFSGRLCSAKKF